MAEGPAIHWFRNDLRLSDNRAFAAAATGGVPVLALFVLDDVTPGPWQRGGASRWWLAMSLAALAKDLKDQGIPLVLRRGNAREVVAAVVAETGARLVTTGRSYEPWSAALEQGLHTDLQALGCTLKRYAGHLLFEPDAVRTQTGDPYKVYTPFWRAVSPRDVRQPVPAPLAARGWSKRVASDKLADWELLPTKPDWAGGMRAMWTPGEAGAQARLERFLDGVIDGYADKRNEPGTDGTSRLSPHLHFGEISPAACWHAVLARSGGKPGKGAETFLKELVWREFSYHLLAQFPTLPEDCFRPEFAAFPWQQDAVALAAWQRGRTGYPIVDAGMRELWQTGWMHNRVRMITASFLIKDLLIPWQAGEAWFWDCLVDADIASNAASWQWVAGCGADAAPYFRIFNPIKQGETFDPDGSYVRRYVPELAGLPNEVIHAPWTADKGTLATAGVRLGETYPLPIVDHAKARDAALAAYARIKKAA